jgi:DNA invertase Pin-like site-specific DNA recombinase
VSDKFVRKSRMFFGYARVSTVDQSLALQRDALTAAGCERIFTDTMTGTSTERPGLTKALAALSAGDTLIVWKLDRLGRSLAHLVQLVADLGGRGIGFRSLSDPIDTESAGGRLVLHIMGALAEFERSLIVERTQAGLQAAKKRGRKLGRPTKLTAAQVGHARALLASGEDGRTVARSFGVARSTLYAALKTSDQTSAVSRIA